MLAVGLGLKLKEILMLTEECVVSSSEHLLNTAVVATVAHANIEDVSRQKSSEGRAEAPTRQINYGGWSTALT